jgi:hypothetical protein
MYADDMVLFLSLTQGDLPLANAIFELFKNSSSLSCNVGMCQLVPIHCDEDQVRHAQELFPCLI